MPGQLPVQIRLDLIETIHVGPRRAAAQAGGIEGQSLPKMFAVARSRKAADTGHHAPTLVSLFRRCFISSAVREKIRPALADEHQNRMRGCQVPGEGGPCQRFRRAGICRQNRWTGDPLRFM